MCRSMPGDAQEWNCRWLVGAAGLRRRQTTKSDRPSHKTAQPQGCHTRLMGLFCMAGGGTGGHVIPALAVARELRVRGHQVYFVGTERGVEHRLVPAEKFPIEYV